MKIKPLHLKPQVSGFRFQVSGLRSQPSAAFTLVEVLVTMAVLVMLVVMVSQLVNSTASVTTKDVQRLDASGEARLIFDRMERDFAGMLRRPDVDCTAYTYNNLASPDSSASNNDSLFKRQGNDSFYFFAESDAYTTSNATAGRFSSVALVGYRIWERLADETGSTSPGDPRSPAFCLERRGGKTIWDTNDTQTGFVFLTFSGTALKSESTLRGQITAGLSRCIYDRTYAPIGPQTFRLEFCFLMKAPRPNTSASDPNRYYLTTTGTTANIDPKKGFSDVAAIVVTIAVLDGKTRAKIPASQLEDANGPMTKLIAKLVDGTTPAVASQWNNALADEIASGSSDIPLYILENTRVYQRYFYLK